MESVQLASAQVEVAQVESAQEKSAQLESAQVQSLEILVTANSKALSPIPHQSAAKALPWAVSIQSPGVLLSQPLPWQLPWQLPHQPLAIPQVDWLEAHCHLGNESDSVPPAS